MFGLTDPSKRPKRKKKPQKTLEFAFDDLETLDKTVTDSTPEEPITAQWTEPMAAKQTTSRPTEKAQAPEPAAPESSTPKHPESSHTLSNKTPKENTHMDPSSIRTPRPIAKDNIKRQKREQSTMNSLIHGIGLAFTCSILIVAALASLGGYVLYKQLSDQSASLAMLEQNTKQRFFEMETDLIKRDTELAKNLEQTNLRLMNMTASFEEFRSQSMEMLAELRSTNQTLAKQLNQARQENAAQRMQLARLETSVRIGR